MVAEEFLAKGDNGQLLVKEHTVVISRKGVMALLTQGPKGDKEIPIENITSIQMKGAGLTAGYIQFTLHGGAEAKGGVLQAGQGRTRTRSASIRALRRTSRGPSS